MLGGDYANKEERVFSARRKSMCQGPGAESSTADRIRGGR